MNRFACALWLSCLLLPHGHVRAEVDPRTGIDWLPVGDRFEIARTETTVWTKCSSRQFIPAVTVPTLIVNALDDPFLVGGCYPVQEAAGSRQVHLEMPRSGGHVGFVGFDRGGAYWSEQRAMEFLSHGG